MTEPLASPALPSSNARVQVVAAHDGAERLTWLENTVQKATQSGARALLIDTCFRRGGPWAGVREFFETLWPTIAAHHPGLVRKHAAELAYVMPARKRDLGPRNQTLTDLAPPEEKVRNYPADRAYRVVHGLIDLLTALRGAEEPGRPWFLVCDRFDEIGPIGQRFFRELTRRRGAALDLRLLVAATPAKADTVASWFEPPAGIQALDLPASARPSPDLERLRIEALALDTQVGDDKDAMECHGPALLYAFRLLGDERRAFRHLCYLLDVYNSLGFYEDALLYGTEGWQLFQTLQIDSDELRWALFNKLFMSNVGLQRAEAAHDVLEQSTLLERPLERARRAQLYYLVAMLHVRYMTAKDLAKGEDYLERGLRDLETAEMPAEDFHFHSVFNRNGLALVRHYQGRFEEAVALCREGFERLEQYLGGDKHKLHRSVLLYNIGQVYATIGMPEDALRYYGAAIEMDPSYSEYYNDRGSLHLRLGHMDDARRDYLRAIELSPPYHEVWTNLGQCCRQAGQLDEAMQAYDVALDLAPDDTVALHGRAQVLEARGLVDEALAAFDLVAQQRRDRWDVFGARAVLLYQKGRLAEAVADLDRAIVLAPRQADLYFNRAVALTELGHADAATADLEAYLGLTPEAADRAEAQARLATLRVTASGLSA